MWKNLKNSEPQQAEECSSSKIDKAFGEEYDKISRRKYIQKRWYYAFGEIDYTCKRKCLGGRKGDKIIIFCDNDKLWILTGNQSLAQGRKHEAWPVQRNKEEPDKLSAQGNSRFEGCCEGTNITFSFFIGFSQSYRKLLFIFIYEWKPEENREFPLKIKGVF